MAAESLMLVVNNTDTGKKYALFRRGVELAHISQEHDDSLGHVLEVLKNDGIVDDANEIGWVALRLAVPSGHFLVDRVITYHELSRLEELNDLAPIQAQAALAEINEIQALLPHAKIVGVSDSAFHATKPDYTWNYGIKLEDADNYDIKRFGYQGIAVESAVRQIKESRYASLSKVVVCHLGNVSSVTAIYNGKSVDTTMGYTPNEGPILGAESGTLGLSAAASLAKQKKISLDELAVQLNEQSGLQGISGAEIGIADLVKKQAAGNHRASLALCMYVYSVRQEIARMVASMEGIDMLVFTGEIGQSLPIIRERVVAGLAYLGIVLSPTINSRVKEVNGISSIQPRTRSKPIIVIATQEERTIQSHARRLLV